MGITVNILTSGFLVSCSVFLLMMGLLFYFAYTKIGAVFLENNSENDPTLLGSALNYIRIAYILAFIAFAVTLLLALLYAGHELVFMPSEWFHLVLYLVVYALLIISVVYAFLALNKIYDLRIQQRNGSTSYIWAGLLMAIFAFVGLTATGSGRLGMNVVRTRTQNRIQAAESKINEHLPAIRSHVEHTRANVEHTLSNVLETRAVTQMTHDKVDNLHADRFGGSQVYTEVEVPAVVTSQVMTSQPAIVSTPSVVASQVATPSRLMISQPAVVSTPRLNLPSLSANSQLLPQSLSSQRNCA